MLRSKNRLWRLSQVRAFNLKHEAGAVDGVVFLFKASARAYKYFFAPVVLVFQVRHHAWRGGSHEYLFGFDL